MIKLQANFTFDTGKNADLGVCDVRKMQEGRRSWDAYRDTRPVLEGFTNVVLLVNLKSVMFLPLHCLTGTLLPLAVWGEEGLWLSVLVFGGSLVHGCSKGSVMSVAICVTGTVGVVSAGRVLGQRFCSQWAFTASLHNEFSYRWWFLESLRS